MANKQHIFKGVVPPSSAPTEVGHHYIDTAAKIMYLSVGTATSADWQVVGSGGAATWGAITGTLTSQTDLQAALDAKQATITGSNGFSIYKDGSGVVKSLEEVQVGFANGWQQLDLTRSMNGIAGNFDIYRNNFSINALQNSPDETWNLFQNQINVDQISSGFTMGTNGTSFRFHINNAFHGGTSDVGATEFIQNNFSFGNGTDPIDVKGFAYMMGFGSFNANTNMTGPAQGYGFQFNVNPAATISLTTYIQGFYDAANIGCASPNYTSFNGSPTISSIANNNNYTGIIINPNITSFTGNANGKGVVVAGNWGSFGTSGGFAGVSINPTATNANYAHGIEVYMNNISTYAGTVSSLIIQDLTLTFISPGDNNNIQVTYVGDVLVGSETAALAGNLVTVHMQSGVSTALQIKAAFQANPTLNGAVVVTISGVGSNTQTSQAATNFTGGTNPGTKKAAYFGGDVEITGDLTFGGALSIGKLNAFATQSLVDTGGNPQSLHSLITQPTVAANSVLTSADMLGVNTAALISIGDNATVGTSFIGMAALGLPAVLSMGTGATLDRCYGALFALSLDASATGGTVDEVGLCKSMAIPNGVTTVSKLYGYLFDLPFGDPGTATWGFYSRTQNHNYLGGDLLIGGTAGSDDVVTNSSVALEIKSTTKAFMNARMTTTERDALTAVNGMQIYNSTTDKLQVYAAGLWVDLH